MYGLVLLVALGAAGESAGFGHRGYPTPQYHNPHWPGGYHTLNGGYHWPGYACWGGCGGYASAAYGVPMTPLITPIPPRVYQLAEEEKKVDEDNKKKEAERLKMEDRKEPLDPDSELDDDAKKKMKPPPKLKKKPDDPEEGKASAVLSVFLPAGARLSIDGRPVVASGMKTFVTPPLEKGLTFYYELTIEAIREGKPVVQNKKVTLQAGDSIHADYRDWGESVAAAKK